MQRLDSLENIFGNDFQFVPSTTAVLDDSVNNKNRFHELTLLVDEVPSPFSKHPLLYDYSLESQKTILEKNLTVIDVDDDHNNNNNNNSTVLVHESDTFEKSIVCPLFSTLSQD